MNKLIIFIGFCLLFYIIDYLTAIKFSKKNFKVFRQREVNKGLVWTVEQYRLTKNKGFLSGYIINTLITLISATIGMGVVGYYLFDLNFYTGVKLFLSVQVIANIIGTLMNTISFYRVKEENK